MFVFWNTFFLDIFLFYFEKKIVLTHKQDPESVSIFSTTVPTPTMCTIGILNNNNFFFLEIQKTLLNLEKRNLLWNFWSKKLKTKKLIGKKSLFLLYITGFRNSNQFCFFVSHTIKTEKTFEMQIQGGNLNFQEVGLRSSDIDVLSR